MPRKRNRATNQTQRECPFCHEVTYRKSLTCPKCGVAACHPHNRGEDGEYEWMSKSQVDDADREMFGGLALEHGWCGLDDIGNK